MSTEMMIAALADYCNIMDGEYDYFNKLEMTGARILVQDDITEEQKMKANAARIICLMKDIISDSFVDLDVKEVSKVLENFYGEFYFNEEE